MTIFLYLTTLGISVWNKTNPMYTASILTRLQELGPESATVTSEQLFYCQKRKVIHKKGNYFVRIKVLTAVVMKGCVFCVD
jgi:hypothetical protein